MQIRQPSTSMILIRFITLSIFWLLVQTAKGQDYVSSYKPKNKTEKVVLEKLKELPETKEHYASRKNLKPDIIMGKPGLQSKYYRFQIGFDYGERFSTNYYLSINPKTLQVYFDDFSDESGDKSITLSQWRRWRANPGFNKPHKWVNGKLVILKDQ